jgi:CelD/BcsL family acetyltransferase involved in cellulose biosynthesis
MSTSACKTTVFRSVDDLDRVNAAVRRLARDDWMLSSSLWMLYGLIAHGEELFPELRWILVEDDTGPAALVPVFAVRETDSRVGFRALWTLTRFELMYADALIRPGVSAHLICREIFRARTFGTQRADVLRISSAPPGSGFHRLLTEQAPNDIRVRAGSSIMPCSADAESWDRSNSRNLRGHLRQSEKRLRERGELSIVEHFSGTTVGDAFDRFVSLEAAGYKASMSPLAAISGDRKVLRDAIVGHAERGEASVIELVIGERLAASQLGVIRDRRVHLIKVAYDETLASASPGAFLMAELLRRRSQDRRAEVIDCCVRQPWHDRWHPALEDRVDGVICNPRTSAGLLLYAMRRLRSKLGR